MMNVQKDDNSILSYLYPKLKKNEIFFKNPERPLFTVVLEEF